MQARESAREVAAEGRAASDAAAEGRAASDAAAGAAAGGRWGEQARVIAVKKLERVASEGKFLLSHKDHWDCISGAVHGAASDATAEGRRRA